MFQGCPKRTYRANVIGLIRDYVHAKNPSPSLFCATFFLTSVVFVLFSRGYPFHLCCFGNKYLIKFKICILKQRLVVILACNLMSSRIRVGTHEGTSPCDWSLQLVFGRVHEGTDRRDLSHEQFTRSVLRNKSQGLVPEIQTGLNS